MHPDLLATAGAGRAIVLVGAGALAGLVGSAGGITSLVSYPALLAIGLGPRAADVANLVALTGCWPGSALASRPELAGQRRWLTRWLPVAATGSLAGTVALLTTSAGIFARVVPWLVLAGSLALVLQPRLTRRRRRGPSTWSLPAGLVASSVYNGYFGAGAGVMTLALLLGTVDDAIPVANALKNMVVGAAGLASLLVLVGFAPVVWSAALSLGAGMLVGSSLGPRVTRRAPSGPLRWAIAALGVALAIQLWVDPSG